MRRTAAVALVLLAGCASTDDAERPPSLVPPPDTSVASTPDARLAEMQTSMTELLERIDVLNARIARLEAGGVAAAAPAAVPAAVPAPTAEAAVATRPPAAPRPAPNQPAVIHAANLADDYRNALVLFGKNRWAEARAAFQRVFDADTGGELADNALYWIGETYFAAGDFSSAMKFYDRVTREYGESNKAPDALFKTGLAFEKSGDLAMARRAFEDTIKRYPYSTPAASAKLELKRIKY